MRLNTKLGKLRKLGAARWRHFLWGWGGKNKIFGRGRGLAKFFTRDTRWRVTKEKFFTPWYSCLSGWGSRTRDQLCSKPSRKVFVYFVVVYRVGVPVRGTSSARGRRARCYIHQPEVQPSAQLREHQVLQRKADSPQGMNSSYLTTLKLKIKISRSSFVLILCSEYSVEPFWRDSRTAEVEFEFSNWVSVHGHLWHRNQRWPNFHPLICIDLHMSTNSEKLGRPPPIRQSEVPFGRTQLLNLAAELKLYFGCTGSTFWCTFILISIIKDDVTSFDVTSHAAL